MEPLFSSQHAAPAARRRAVAALILLVLGFAAALTLHLSSLVWAMGAITSAALAIVVSRSTARASSLRHALLALSFAAGCAAWCVHRVVDPALPSFVASLDPLDDPRRVLIEGVVLDDPRQSPVSLDPVEPLRRRAPLGVCTVSLRAVEVDSGDTDHRRVMASASGVVRVSLPGASYSGATGLSGFPCRTGDRVRVIGTFRPVAPGMNPGSDRWAADPSLLANQDSLLGSLVAPSASLVTIVTHHGMLDRAMAPCRRALADVRSRSLTILDPGPGADPLARAFLLSLLLGDDASGDREVSSLFARAGVSHVLAISGVHVAVVVAVGLFFLRALREPGRVEPLAIAILVVAYLVLVPAQAPVVRSGILAIVLTLARFFGRRYDALPLLLWAAVALALWRPLDVWSLGYQLSVGLSALMVWRSQHFADRLFHPRLRGVIDDRPWQVRSIAAAGRATISTTILCSLVSLPLIAWHTGRFSPAAIPAALVILPLVAVLMHAGYALLVAGMVLALLSPGAPHALGSALVPLSSLCVRVTAWFESLPGASFTIPTPGAAWTAGATGVMLWFLLAARWRTLRPWLALALVALWGWVGAPAPPAWRIQTLSLRDSLCTVIDEGGRAIVLNAGASEPWSGARAIEGALVAGATPRAECVTVARPDLEHAGALHALWSQGRVGAWALSPLAARSSPDETTTIPRLSRAIGEPALSPKELEWVGQTAARVTLGGVRFLDASSLTRPELHALLDQGVDLRAEVLELPHAQGVWRETQELVRRASPLVVIQTDPPHVVRDMAGDKAWRELREGRAWIATSVDGAAMVTPGPGGAPRASAFSAASSRTRGSRTPGAGP